EATPAPAPTAAQPPSAEATPARAPTAAQAPALAPLPEADRPEVDIDVTPSGDVHTGDALRATITVTAKTGDEVHLTPAPDVAPFEIAGQITSRHERAARAGMRRTVITVPLVALKPGDVTLGPLRLDVLTAAGVAGTVQTRAVPIHVAALTTGEVAPKPPSDPVSLMEPNPRFWWGLGVASLLLALAVAAVIWRRRRAQRPAPAAPPPSPAEVALAELRSLRQTLPRMLAEGRAERWTDELSDTLRRYLGARCGFDALERTTHEIARYLRDAPALAVPAGEVVGFLRRCDLVKFADAPLSEAEGAGLLDEAERVVVASRASRPPAPSAPPPRGPDATGSTASPPDAPPEGTRTAPSERSPLTASTPEVGS
ncbi:MAG: hypothetical protein KC543_13220, partial [Myxococcales bacterium]|nr:hypothetical protein [Myxococcales bacterium]